MYLYFSILWYLFLIFFCFFFCFLIRYPTYTPVFHAAIDLWFNDPQVTTPVLKLYAEFVHNRSQRLQFDISSPNGILLFRDASKLLVNYGTKILMIRDIPSDRLYAMKLKGISICFSILKLALSGSYVNFGVFELYGDTALKDALSTFIKLILSISITDILVIFFYFSLDFRKFLNDFFLPF